jgi:phosphopantothenate-cysteine ligase
MPGPLTDEDAAAFITANLPDKAIEDWSNCIAPSLTRFLECATAAGRRLCVITSGGTSVPLERNAVRFVTNFSTGSRGSALAEELVERGASVVFLGKRGSQLPFHRTVSSLDSPLDHLGDANVARALKAWTDASQPQDPKILLLEFESVVEYLGRLRVVARRVQDHKLPSPPVLVLAAAVSDYYVPWADMAEHKMSGVNADGSITLRLHQVPKVMGVLRTEWAPAALLVSFKLETDPAVLENKALGNLVAYGCDAVIANLLASYRRKATVYRAGVDPVVGAAEQLEVPEGQGLEGRMADIILALRR